MMPALRYSAIAILLTGCRPSPARTVDIDARLVQVDANVDSAETDPCLSPGAPHGPLGRCRCTTDCIVGAVCGPENEEQVDRPPGGMCVLPCTVDQDCGQNAFCKYSTSTGRCVPRCQSSSDCELGRYCFFNECVPFCQADDQCDSGHCNRSQGRCVDADFVPEGAPTSAMCSLDRDCQSALCDVDARACFTICAVSARGCPDGEFCSGGGAAIDAGQCFQTCTTAKDCRHPNARCVDIGERSYVCMVD